MLFLRITKHHGRSVILNKNSLFILFIHTFSGGYYDFNLAYIAFSIKSHQSVIFDKKTNLPFMEN